MLNAQTTKSEQKKATAAATAAMRAAHLLYHQSPVFNDPYALQLTGPVLRRACQNRFVAWLLRRKFISQSLRPLTAQVVARAKYAEEKLAQAVCKGISQYVIIGAGFDSFCLRRPRFAAGLQIYEIDHPATQEIKRERLLAISDATPEGVAFLPADLEKRTIAGALSTSSFLKDEPAFFSWLGTVPYLSQDAVFKVLEDIASLATPGSEIVFDYLIPTSMWAQEERQALLRILRIIERRGEAVRSYFAPHTFPGDVSRLGYRILENISPAQLNENYFSGRSDGLATHSAAYMIHAAVSHLH